MFDLVRLFFSSRQKERSRINEKLDHLDSRIDILSMSSAKVESSVYSLSQIALSNQELFEQKLNNNRAAQENLKEMITLRMSMLEDLIKSK